ncbi:hypothetical protein [Lichenicoccus roseus]|uniref:Uncharacterized protein n=1 Tax=Lichenicoccus roseus TaxID=2683649 RepID=A0A5R9J208_9PROT|nr:hypothetical protein [Lichenicoccus roseus]TLU70893.1 hypothetical protein FE263_20140 [Lichenicoccus roseus]
MSNLARLGLQPDPDANDPDARLFQLLEQAARCQSAWEDCRSHSAASDFVTTERAIARAPAVSLLALIDKAEHALAGWRDDSDSKHDRIYAAQAAALAQAVDILRLFTEQDIAERRARE